MRNILQLLLGVCLCFTLPTHAAKERIDAKGKIHLTGHVPDKCFVKINNKTQTTLKTSDGSRQSANFSVSSECNRKSTHSLQISYSDLDDSGTRGKLKLTDDNTKVVPYSIHQSGSDAPLAHNAKIDAVGMKSSNSMYVKFDPPANATKGTYTGQVTITLTGV